MLRFKKLGVFVLALVLFCEVLPYSVAAAIPQSTNFWSIDRLAEALQEIDNYYQSLIGQKRIQFDEAKSQGDTRSTRDYKNEIERLLSRWDEEKDQLICSAGWEQMIQPDNSNELLASLPSDLTHSISTYFPPGGGPNDPILVTANYEWLSDADAIAGPYDLLAVVISNRHNGWGFSRVTVTAYNATGNMAGRCIIKNGLGDVESQTGSVHFEGPQDNDTGTGMYFYIDEGSKARNARNITIYSYVTLGSGTCKTQCEYVHNYGEWQLQGFSIDHEGMFSSIYGIGQSYWKRRTAYRFLAM